MRPYALSDISWPDTQDSTYAVAVLPWGATEPHNTHLPYATDTIQAEAVALEAARQAHEQGGRPLVLPAIPFGANGMQLGLGPVIDLAPSTQALVLADVVRSLEAAGIERLVILNGHGGNDFKPMIRELQGQTDVFLCAVDWFRGAAPGDFFDVPGDHAGELETSTMMHLRPDLVRPIESAGPGAERLFRVAALREGWAWAPRDWHQMTTDTGVGNPSASTPEKGAAFVEAVTEQLASFLVELAAMDPADPYL